jgi:hypothetical protein
LQGHVGSWLALGLGGTLSTVCLVRNVWGGWVGEVVALTCSESEGVAEAGETAGLGIAAASTSGGYGASNGGRKERNMVRIVAGCCHCIMIVLLKLRFI